MLSDGFAYVHMLNYGVVEMKQFPFGHNAEQSNVPTKVWLFAITL